MQDNPQIYQGPPEDYLGPYAETETPTQEQIVETTQELPAVSKLREAFDTARNAIIDGSKLAEQVTELSLTVGNLKAALSDLQRDLEYVRNRNRELDEQVSQVRQARDTALADAVEQRQLAGTAEAATTAMRGMNEAQGYNISRLQEQLKSVKKERDDAMVMALEYEGKLKAAEAKLARIEEVFGMTKPVAPNDPSIYPPKPVPHYEVQPRDEVGKFQPFDEGKSYPHGSQSEGEGF